MCEYKIVPVNRQFAVEISKWVYPEPYTLYSFDGSEETVEELLVGSYYAVLTGQSELVGYYCFGAAAQIPTAEEGVYTKDAVDFGLGLRPDLCGKGKGEAFAAKGLAFAKENARGENSHFRLTVAGFNERAAKVYRRLGFCPVAAVQHKYSGMPFLVMVCRR